MGVRRVFSNPIDVLVARTVVEVQPALEAVERATRQGLDAAGYLAYEAAPAFDRAFRIRGSNRMPLLWFGLFEPGGAETRAVPKSAASTEDATDAYALGVWRHEVSRERYDACIAQIREAIAQGRTYQVNHTIRMRSCFQGSAAALYEHLRRAQGPGYHALLDLGEFAIVSVSPELFFHRDGTTLTTRPMKGTRPRGRWTSEDMALARELRGSEKDKAENRMIVDLLRSDLGRVASVGSVRVPEHFEVEQYRTVLQMTSTVTASVTADVGLPDLFGALFPCGSVTGAPKISTMELIADLESSPREVYCGAIGFVEGWTRRATFNVPIRTLWVDRSEGVATYGAGGGITWDSTADGEYAELETKTAVLFRTWPDFDLLETMRLEEGRIPRRALHLERLAEACRYFGRQYPEERVRQALDAAAERTGRETRRIRLLLSESGDVRIEILELGDASYAPGPPWGGAPSPGELPEVALANQAVDSRDPFLCHKTTHRAVYEAHAAEHPGAFDVVLYNGEGEVTEMTRGNLVVEVDGRRITPHRSAGLLAGCFRQELLDRGLVEEARVSLAELMEASRIWAVNSVRGWTEVRLASAAPDADGAAAAAREWACA